MFCKHEIWMVPDLAVLIGGDYQFVLRCKKCGKQRKMKGSDIQHALKEAGGER